jgi:SAM-dependent methyltransferase
MPNPLLQLAGRAARLDARAARAAAHDWDVVGRALLRRMEQAYGPALSALRVLDFGCGFTYPLVVLLQPHVREVVGLEVSPVYRDGPVPAARYAGGLLRAGSSAEALLAFAQAARYYRHLQRRTGTRLRHDTYRIVRYDGRTPPLAPESFDCVVSNAVLQELPLPLEEHARRIARLLKPRGRIDLEWHNFYSLTGRYVPEAEARSDPWGHLAGGRCHPDLNRVTPDQVLEAFSPWFAGLRLLRHDREYRLAGQDPGYQPEGADLLTPELEARYRAYPREWLLTRGYILQGVRR